MTHFVYTCFHPVTITSNAAWNKLSPPNDTLRSTYVCVSNLGIRAKLVVSIFPETQIWIIGINIYTLLNQLLRYYDIRRDNSRCWINGRFVSAKNNRAMTVNILTAPESIPIPFTFGSVLINGRNQVWRKDQPSARVTIKQYAMPASRQVLCMRGNMSFRCTYKLRYT